MGNGFSKDSPETKFVENIPVLGYIASAVHAAAGNEEHAKRAAAKCTNTNLAVLGGVAGGLVGGPLGAMAGATAGKSVGIASEHGISHHIKDKDVRSEVGSVRPERFLIEGAFSAVGGGVGTVGSEIAKAGLKEAGVQGIAATAGSIAARQGLSHTFTSVPQTAIDSSMYK